MREAANDVPPKTMILSAAATSPSASEPSAAQASDQPQESSPLDTLKVFFNYGTVGSGILLAMLSLQKRRYLLATWGHQRSNPQPSRRWQWRESRTRRRDSTSSAFECMGRVWLRRYLLGVHVPQLPVHPATTMVSDVEYHHCRHRCS